MKNIPIFLLLVLCSRTYAINPEREYRFTPTMRGLNYQEYQIKTPDEYSINVWEYTLADSVKTNRTIIMVGSDAGNMGYMVWQARAFMKQGIRVISFDYRGFGKSSDFSINRDFLYHSEFVVDLDSVLRTVRAKYPNDKVGLYSISMGTYVSLLRKEKIDFYIAEGFYHNPHSVVARIKTNRNETVILPARAREVRKLNPHVPVLIFCADKDKTTTTADARLFSKRNKVTMLEFEGEHLHGMNVMTVKEPGDLYAAKIVEFLNSSKI